MAPWRHTCCARSTAASGWPVEFRAGSYAEGGFDPGCRRPSGVILALPGLPFWPRSVAPILSLVTQDSERPQGATQPKKRLLRPEIQALRAIAVATVVVFHYWPDLISGGYIGVDVFFAISGFLITGHLVREVDRSGHVSLAGFWARRARRILPAALLVLLFCAVATFLVVPLNLWDQFFTEIQASTLYVENWYLANQAVDYLGAHNRPSPVQHYWSLSVEEQFYIVWPVLILIAMTIVRKGSALLRRRSIIVMLALLTGLSLAYSIWDTANDPAAAFFVTPTRVWEFGAGGLLAMLATSSARPQLRAAVSWLGIAMVLIAAFVYTPETAFPGASAMLPIAGTLAVIWAGSPELRWAPTGWMSLRPAQWLGDVSYSVYLWHWPLLILTPFLLLRELDTPIKLGLVALTLILAALSKRFVEDPLRSGPLLASHRPRRSFAFVLVGTGTVLLATVGALAVLTSRQNSDLAAAKALLGSRAPCLGAASRDPLKPGCLNPNLRLSVVPSPASARLGEGTKTKIELCSNDVSQRDGTLELCVLGVPPERAKLRAALIGDSHSFKWRTGMSAAALARDWNVTSIGLEGCQFSTAVVPVGSAATASECKQWKREVLGWIDRHPQVHTIFISQIAERYSPASYKASVSGYREQWSKLPPSVKQIIVLRDNPRMKISALDCVERAMAAERPAGPACARQRSQALDQFPDPAAAAAKSLRRPGVGVVDLTEFYCDRSRCYPVIGGLLVNSDESHVTPAFNATLAPFLLRAVDSGGWLAR